jgi:hypothetical protein
MILSLVFIGFVLVIVGVLAWFFAPAFLGPAPQEDTQNDDGGINFFPFGDGGEATDPTDEPDRDDADPDETDEPSDPIEANRMPRLRQVSEGPVIAAYVSEADTHSGIVGPAATSTNDAGIENTIRYVELGTGHVYEGSTFNRDIKRLSNTTIPRINEAQFVGLNRILMRYTDDLGNFKLFSAEIVDNASQNASTPKRLQGTFLPDGVQYIDVGPDGQIVWLQTIPNGTRVVTTNATGDDQTQIYSSVLSEWRVDWHGATNEVILQSTPSYESFGMAYTLDVQTGDLRPYGAARKALQVLPTPDRSRALVSLVADETTQLYLWSRDDNEYIELVPQTFAEKCVYAQVRDVFYCATPVQEIAATEPDLWYQGVSSYRDDIWVIDGQTGAAELAVSPSGVSDDPIDIVDLSISNDEQFLYFRDKDTRSLWTFQIDYIRSGANPNDIGGERALQDANTESSTTTTEEPVFFE